MRSWRSCGPHADERTGPRRQERRAPAAMTRGLFITGTDTGVGKTVVGVAVLRALVATGWSAIGMKPVAAGRAEGEALNADVAALLAAANASGLGLSSAVFTSDLDRAFWFAERLQTGQVTVNDTSNYWELHLPFGGWAGKSSGRGRVGGRQIFEAFTQLRSVAFDVGRGKA